MSLTSSSVRCALQVALLGNISLNLRAVNVQFNDHSIRIDFYYNQEVSEEDIEESEIVISEVLSSYVNIAVTASRTVLELPKPIPDQGLRVFHRKE